MSIFMGMSDQALVNELRNSEWLLNNPYPGFDADEMKRHMDEIRAEQARREPLPKVWVVTSVWSPKDESDSLGEYPLSGLALFEDKDTALKFAIAEVVNYAQEDEDDEDATPVGLTEKDDGSWEAEIDNYSDRIWVEVRRVGVR